MSEDTPKLSVKEKLFDFMVSASNAVSKTSHVSTFATTGKLTPEEFVAAGDLLVYKCGSWSWSGGEPSKRVDYLPPDKQFLITRHVTCNPVKKDASVKDQIVEDEWLSVAPGEDEEEEVTEAPSSSNTYGVDDDDDEDGDDEEVADAETFDELNLVDNVADLAIAGDQVRKTRTYDVTICYNKYFQVPHVWLFGYSKTGQPLKPVQMYEDISEDHRGQTVTVKPHPHLSAPYASIHPCRHADVMQKIVNNMKRLNKEPRVDQYMFIFLKFLSAVIPNIEYDNTFDLDISLYPHDLIWSVGCNPSWQLASLLRHAANMAASLSGKQLSSEVCHMLLYWLGTPASSKLACLNKEWSQLVLPQLYRRLLNECIPGLTFAEDQSPGLGDAHPPIAGETWKSLFDKLVIKRENVHWRPVATVLESAASSSTNLDGVVTDVDEELCTSAPKSNTYMYMPLPENYDSRTTPVGLPDGFQWVDLDLNSEEHVSSLSAFLTAHALTDSEGLFQLGWSPAHIRRQMLVPSSPTLVDDASSKLGLEARKPVYVAVETDGARGPKKLIGFIAAIPVHLRMWRQVQPFYMVRQLCVLERLRGHRVARVLVKELSRRIHQQHGKSYIINPDTSKVEIVPAPPAVFTLGVNMPFRCLTEFTAYHRTLQHSRLVAAGLHPTIDAAQASVAHFNPKLDNLLPFDLKDLHLVFPFVCSFFERFKIGLSYTGAEFAHRYRNRPGYTVSYVLWSTPAPPATRRPIGFFSFSEMNYNVLKTDADVKQLRIAYVDVIFPVENISLIKSLLVIAHDLGYDEVEIGTNMEHNQIISHEELLFRPGTGRALQYVHNWFCDEIEPKDWSLSENN